MGRLIDAVTTAEAIIKAHNIPLADLVDTFATIPTIDAEPVVYGEWKQDEEASKLGEFCYCKCSECETAVTTDDIVSLQKCYQYCPNCGAKMGNTP